MAAVKDPPYAYELDGPVWRRIHKVKGDIGRWIADNPDLVVKVGALEWEVGDDDVEELPPNIALFQNLSEMTIRRGKSLKSVSNHLFSFNHLSGLKLEDCPNLLEFPSNMGQDNRLNCLSITNCGIRSLPHSLQHLYNLELKQCGYLQQLPPLLYVSCLTIEGCPLNLLQAIPPTCKYISSLEVEVPDDVKSFPDVFAHLDYLHALHIKGGISLKRFPPSLSTIPIFNNLHIANCLQLKELPFNLTLENLTISDSKCKTLPSNIVRLSHLKTLKLQGLCSLEELPPDLNRMANLEELSIIDCANIKFLPSLFGLDRLRKLNVNGCPNILMIVDNEHGNAQSLQDITKGHLFQSGYISGGYVGGASGCAMEWRSSHGSSSTISFGSTKQAFSPKIVVKSADERMWVTRRQCPDNERSSQSSFSVHQEVSSFCVKAKYKENTIEFEFMRNSSLVQLKQDIANRLPLEASKVKICYLDDDGDWVLMACHDDLEKCMELSFNSGSCEIQLRITDLSV